MNAHEGYVLEADGGGQGAIQIELDKLEKSVKELSEQAVDLREVLTPILEDLVPTTAEKSMAMPADNGIDSEITRRIRNARESVQGSLRELTHTRSRLQV